MYHYPLRKNVRQREIARISTIKRAVASPGDREPAGDRWTGDISVVRNLYSMEMRTDDNR
jgi:hypothetical protein